MPQAFNAYEKDFLREYHYRFYECFESAQRTADAELCILLSGHKEEWHIQRFRLTLSDIYILSLTMEQLWH